jgi:hypothetical protein
LPFDAFQHRQVFIPLGDDFRWDSADEANKQFLNYKQLFDHV